MVEDVALDILEAAGMELLEGTRKRNGGLQTRIMETTFHRKTFTTSKRVSQIRQLPKTNTCNQTRNIYQTVHPPIETNEEVQDL